jgi:hypothetical protein
MEKPNLESLMDETVERARYFQISVPWCPTNYNPQGNDVLDIVVHRDVRLSDGPPANPVPHSGPRYR